MEKKMTKIQKFEMLCGIEEVMSNPILREFIEHEMELLNRKHNPSERQKAQQIADSIIKDAIYEFANPTKLYTVTELMKSVPACADLSNQKVTSILLSMVKEGSVERVVEKRKTYYRTLEE